jgi:hypothetical protein
VLVRRRLISTAAVAFVALGGCDRTSAADRVLAPVKARPPAASSGRSVDRGDRYRYLVAPPDVPASDLVDVPEQFVAVRPLGGDALAWEVPEGGRNCFVELGPSPVAIFVGDRYQDDVARGALKVWRLSATCP